MNFINGYLISKYEFRTVKNDYTTAVTPNIYHQYHDIETGMLYLWDSKQFRDASFYQGYQYSKYDSVERILPEHIYLAQPGHRIIGRINGIDDDSCSLDCNLNNADELSFTVYRMIDGEEIPFYEQIARLYELYIPNYGWFKITEEPQIDNDGTVETKSVTAESLEIELQQYDLID